MTSSPRPQRTKANGGTRPAALTGATKAGRAFERRPEVDAEIAAALAQPPSTWGAWARRAPGKTGMHSETIVHLIGALAERPDQRRVLGELVLALDARVLLVARKFARGFDETTLEEIAIEVGQRVMEMVLDPVGRAGFLQAAFITVVKGKVLDAVKKRRHAPPAYAVAAALAKREPRDDADERDPNDEKLDPDAIPDGDGAPDDEVDRLDAESLMLAAEARALRPELIRKALGSITNPVHREAVNLHFLQGWPITDRDPGTHTLCTRFGVTERQIRRWIAAALAEMRHAIGETS